jgi:CTP:molybdopterin cytidylyltransferase MocA
MTTHTHQTSRIELAVDGTTWWLQLDGYLDESALARLDDALSVAQQPGLRVVLTVTCTRYAPGALASLRQLLRRHHDSQTAGNPLTVRSDEPQIRAALPTALMSPAPAGNITQLAVRPSRSKRVPCPATGPTPTRSELERT